MQKLVRVLDSCINLSLLSVSIEDPLCLIDLAFSWQPHSSASARKLASAWVFIDQTQSILGEVTRWRTPGHCELNMPKTPLWHPAAWLSRHQSYYNTSTRAVSYGLRMAETH